MKIKSPALGDVELTGRIDTLKTQDDHIIMAIRISEPVSWRVRVALTHKDFTSFLFHLIKSKVAIFLLTGFRNRRNPKLPDEFHHGC